MRKFILMVKNTLLIFFPLVILLLLGWQQYIQASTLINSSPVNILPNTGLDTLDSRVSPVGWQLSAASSAAQPDD